MFLVKMSGKTLHIQQSKKGFTLRETSRGLMPHIQNSAYNRSVRLK